MTNHLSKIKITINVKIQETSRYVHIKCNYALNRHLIGINVHDSTCGSVEICNYNLRLFWRSVYPQQ